MESVLAVPMLHWHIVKAMRVAWAKRPLFTWLSATGADRLAGGHWQAEDSLPISPHWTWSSRSMSAVGKPPSSLLLSVPLHCLHLHASSSNALPFIRDHSPFLLKIEIFTSPL